MDAISNEIAIMKSFGLIPMYNQTMPQNRILFYMKYVINLIVTFSFSVSIWMNIILNFENSGEVIETLYFGLTETTFVAKLINIHFRYKTYQNLVKYLSNPVFNQYTREQEAFIKKGITLVHIFAHAFRGCVTITIMFFIVFPFLDKSDNLLIIPSWFPSSVERYQFFCYLFQLWGIIINGYVHSSHDSMVAGLIMMGSAQFEILKNNLNNLRKGLRMPASDIEKEMQEDYILKKLRTYVHHHVVTIK